MYLWSEKKEDFLILMLTLSWLFLEAAGWCWIVGQPVLCGKWNIKHRSPWDGNESMLTYIPELMTFILSLTFTVQIQFSQKEETNDGPCCHLICLSHLPPSAVGHDKSGRLGELQSHPQHRGKGMLDGCAFIHIRTLVNGSSYIIFNHPNI